MLVASTSTGGLALPSSVDVTGLGVAAVVVVIVLRVWWLERQDRIAAQQALLELTERVVATGAAQAAALDRSTDATRALTDEVRRMGDRR